MNRITNQNELIKKEKRLGLMTHVVLGYPNMEETRKLILMMVEEGVDFIELQIPFSDPLGDGATIRVANSVSLENGFRVSQAFELVKKLREEDGTQIPLLFMTYFNIVHKYGVEKFCQDSSGIGIDGLIIPDYTDAAEERDRLRELSDENGLFLVDFLSPDSDEKYIRKVGGRAEGFVYCFARRGVTGGETEFSAELRSRLARYRSMIKCELAVGFGISSTDQVEMIRNAADIAIVGSAAIRGYDEGGLPKARELIRSLISACR